ncbi:MAG TPA: alpha/beta fold hydrolase [Methylibium sp.]|nr:alpha/beta fold hydrolase [Methylibium sp.]
MKRLPLWLPLLAALAGGARADPTAECRVDGLRQAVRCGVLSRPLDPQRPDGTRIELHYLVVPATAQHKRPDPLFFFAGGPGQSAIALAGQVAPLLGRLGQRRDLVFIDQRGTGRSAPLDCGEEDEAALPLPERLDAEAQIARVAACRERLQALPHGDLRQYATPTAMADADAVRAALGAERVNLVGVSYGTRAALEYLRQFPQRVRRVVLDGVAPADMVLPASLARDTPAVLDALLAACAAEPACARRHPRLAARWRDWLATLPREVRVADPASGRDVALKLDRAAVAQLLRAPLYAPAIAAALPYALEEAMAGRLAALVGLPGALGSGGRRGAIATGQHFSVVCAEDFPGLGAAALPGDFGESAALPYRRLCPDWPRAALPTGYGRLVPSPAPVLALSGALDPVAPPRHGERVVAALGPQARHVVVPHAGHGVLGLGCARELLHRFIDAEREADALALDTACLTRIPRPLAFEPPRPGGAP